MIKKILLLCSLLFLVGCSNEPDLSAKKPSDVEQGLVSTDESKVYSYLSVISEQIVGRYENVNEIYIGNRDIEVTRVSDVTDINGNTYKNIFRISGNYSINNTNSTFYTMVSFNEDEFTSDFIVTHYNSSDSGTIVDIEMQ